MGLNEDLKHLRVISKIFKHKSFTVQRDHLLYTISDLYLQLAYSV